MKISFMTFACKEWSFKQVLEGAVRHKYHGIEFRTSANHAHGVEPEASADQRKQFRKALEDAGIEPCCLATSLRFVQDRAVSDAPALIDLAADLGCPGLRVFCGPLEEGVSRNDAVQIVGENLAQVADHAEKAGVGLWLETHDTFVRAADAAAAVSVADHPVVGINYDNMHPYRFDEPLDVTDKALNDHICHTHFHDAVKIDRVEIKPLDQGDMPMDDMFQLLLKKNYDGYLSGEWFKDQYGADSDTALAAFHRDMTELARRNGVTLGD